MKTTFLCIALFCYQLSIAQSVSNPLLPNGLKRVSTPKFNIDNVTPNTILLPMEFNGADSKAKLVGIKTEEISSVSLVYTRYKLSETFNQLALNAQRMQRLYAALPALKSNTAVQWYWVEQTNCDDAALCTDFFHGFVITTKSIDKEVARETEIDLLDYYSDMYEGKMESGKMDSIIKVRKINLVKVCDTVTTQIRNTKNKMATVSHWKWKYNEDKKLIKYLSNELDENKKYEVKLLLDEKGKLYLADDKNSIEKSKKVLELAREHLTIINPRYNKKKIACTIYLSVDAKAPKGDEVKIIQEPILPNGVAFDINTFLYTTKKSIKCEYVDTTKKERFGAPDIITRVFDRNTQWKNCLIATDVTGSMFPYLAQFKLWHKLHLTANKKNSDFIFFNDGNTTPDFLKITGNVGGTYYVHTTNFDSLIHTMKTAMYNGDGGDCPENNIEAVLDGLTKTPMCKEVIMIADNWATPRDLSLLKKVKVPIRLIVCGAQIGINTKYLDLVRENKGSIHTMENDIYNFAELMNGQTIQLDNYFYKIVDGKFKQITKTI